MKENVLKIVSFVIAITAIGSACKKTDQAKITSPKTPIEQIKDLGVAYYGKNKSLQKTTAPASTGRQAKLAVADAIGAALGAGLGPWGALWGGFMGTLSIEPYVRDSQAKISVVTSTSPGATNSSLFEYGIVGDGHNALMYDAYSNNMNADLATSGTSFNATVRNLMVTKNVGLSLNGQTQSTVYNSLEPNLVTIKKYIDSVTYDTSYIYNLIAYSNLTSDTKAVIATIYDDINQYYIFDTDNYSNYLNDIEDIINASNYSNTTKEEVKQFLAVANSSSYFWGINFLY